MVKLLRDVELSIYVVESTHLFGICSHTVAYEESQHLHLRFMSAPCVEFLFFNYRSFLLSVFLLLYLFPLPIMLACVWILPAGASLLVVFRYGE